MQAVLIVRNSRIIQECTNLIENKEKYTIDPLLREESWLAVTIFPRFYPVRPHPI